MITTRFLGAGTLILVVMVLLATGLVSSGLHAQTGTELDHALVEKRLADLRADGVAEDAEIATLYQQVKDFITQADTFNRESANYVESMTTAPQQQREIQARMDARQQSAGPDSSLENKDKEALTALLATARSQLAETRSRTEALDRSLAARETNAMQIRSRLTEVNARIDTLPEDIAAFEPAAKPTLAEAKLWLNTAELVALLAERRALEARLASQPARYSLMTVQRAESALNMEQMSVQVREVEGHLQLEVAEVLDARSLGILPQDPLYMLAERLTTSDRDLREENIEIGEKLAIARGQLEEVERLHSLLEDRFATARRVVDFAADSDSLGSVLLAYAREIEKFTISDPTEDLSRNVGGSVIRRINLEEELKQLSSASGFIEQQMGIEGIESSAVPESSRVALVDLVGNYRTRLRSVIRSESEYIETLSDLGDRYTGFIGLINEYDTYLKGLILWIPAYQPLWMFDRSSATAELAVLDQAVRSIRPSISPWVLLCLALAALLLIRRPRLKAHQEELNKRIARPRHDSIVHTVHAVATTFLRALPLPLLVLALGLALSPPAIATSLIDAAVVFFLLQFARMVCASGGVGLKHFQWSASTLKRLHRDLGLLIFWLPLVVVSGFVLRATNLTGEIVLARLMITSVALVAFVVISTGVAGAIRSTGKAWFREFSNQLRLALLAVLATAGVAIVLGHVYSVELLLKGLLDTVTIGACLLFTHGFLMRWLRVTTRRLRLVQWMEAREEHGSNEDSAMEQQVADLGDVSAETSQLINAGVFGAALFWLFYIWSPLLPAFDALSKITLWTSVSVINDEVVQNRISLSMLLRVIFLASLTIYAARKLPALIDLVLRSRTSVSASVRYTVSSLLNYIILGGGFVAALSALGVQWSQLQWLVAALGVGIGFGLQEIIANFISGLIILFERPIRVGDVVSTGGEEGVVSRIRIRATTIVDWNGKELLVPNKEFITGRLLNWSLSDTKVRTVLPVGIAYGNDVELAIKTLYDIVSNHPRVVNDPEPQIVFESFGDNALMLSARCFLNSLENRMGVVTEMNREIYRRFEEEGLVIAFPQRDIHFDADKPIRIALESDDGSRQ